MGFGLPVATFDVEMFLGLGERLLGGCMNAEIDERMALALGIDVVLRMRHLRRVRCEVDRHRSVRVDVDLLAGADVPAVGQVTAPI